MHFWTNRITVAAAILAILLSATVCRSQTCAQEMCGEYDPSWSFVTFELNCGSTADDAVVTWQISSDAYNYFTDVLVQFEYNCTDIRGYSEAAVLVPKSNVMAGIPGRWSQGTTCRVWGCLFPLCHDCPLCLTIAEQSCSVPLVTSADTSVITETFVDEATYTTSIAITTRSIASNIAGISSAEIMTGASVITGTILDPPPASPTEAITPRPIITRPITTTVTMTAGSSAERVTDATTNMPVTTIGIMAPGLTPEATSEITERFVEEATYTTSIAITRSVASIMTGRSSAEIMTGASVITGTILDPPPASPTEAITPRPIITRPITTTVTMTAGSSAERVTDAAINMPINTIVNMAPGLTTETFEVTMAEPILVSTAVIALVGIMPAVLVFLILFVVQKCRNRNATRQLAQLNNAIQVVQLHMSTQKSDAISIDSTDIEYSYLEGSTSRIGLEDVLYSMEADQSIGYYDDGF